MYRCKNRALHVTAENCIECMLDRITELEEGVEKIRGNAAVQSSVYARQICEIAESLLGTRGPGPDPGYEKAAADLHSGCLCDWGHCINPAVGVRKSKTYGWLPICEDCWSKEEPNATR